MHYFRGTTPKKNPRTILCLHIEEKAGALTAPQKLRLPRHSHYADNNIGVGDAQPGRNSLRQDKS
jgi:hypothetical protein